MCGINKSNIIVKKFLKNKKKQQNFRWLKNMKNNPTKWTQMANKNMEKKEQGERANVFSMFWL